MFFFRVELSLFDEERQTIYLYPDTQALDKDEMPVFSEAALKANVVFKAYIKRLKTGVVDVEYRLYSTDTALTDDLNDETFDQLLSKNKLELIEGNDFCIICGKSGSKPKRKNSSFMFVLIIAAAAVFFIGAASMKKENPPVTDDLNSGSSTVDINQAEESADSSSDISTSDESSDIPEESSSGNFSSSVKPQESVPSSADTSTSSSDTSPSDSTDVSSTASSTTPQTNSSTASSQPAESTSSVSDVP